MHKGVCLAIVYLLQVVTVAFGGGPVYVNSGDPSFITPSSTNNDNLITQTVYGFLDFTTTIANTVMVFSPQSQPPRELKPTKASTIVATSTTSMSTPTTTSSSAEKFSSKVEVKTSSASSKVEVKTSSASPKVELKTSSVIPPVIISSKVEVKEGPSVLLSTKSMESTPVKDLRPKSIGVNGISKTTQSKPKVEVEKAPVISSKVQVKVTTQEPAIFENNLEQAEYDFLSRQPSEVIDETYKVLEVGPTSKSRHGVTGLVTKLGGTVVKEGTTTVHETSVIGTYISGKYAQVLKSSSHLIHRPTSTLHKSHAASLKTRIPLEPSVLEDSLPLEALFTTPPAQNLVRQSRRPAVSPPFKNRPQRTRAQEIPEATKRQGSRPPFKLSHNRFNRQGATVSEIPTVSVFSENLSPTRKYHRHRSASLQAATSASNTIETGTRRYKPKPTPANLEPSTSLYKFKLSRPQGRWHYKTTSKPRVAIRRQDEETLAPTPSLPEIENSEQQTDVSETPVSSTPTPSLPIQTIKVDISTPADFSNVYYEIAVIKSPYTFQVGTVKNTRYVTVTSTQEKLLIEPTEASSTEPLTENILTTKPAFDKEASIATLPPISIGGEETIPLETTTELFSTSEFLLKTHLLPVVRESNTTTITLVQTYEVTKLVTATKTLPPTELFQFIPSKTLNEFNTKLDEAGSELHLELDFGDNNNEDEQPPARAVVEFHNTTEPPTPTVSMIVNSPSPLIQDQLSPEKLQQLAFLRFLNPNQPPVLASTPVLSIQTIYETHVIPVFNGQSTLFSTISRPVGTVTSTQYMTSTVALPSLPLPLFPTPQLQAQFTSQPVITQTIVTETDSKILKLTFGAKTAYTTLYSTRVVPTLLTTYLTAQLPVQPTAAPFPPFFPQFNPFSFVG